MTTAAAAQSAQNEDDKPADVEVEDSSEFVFKADELSESDGTTKQSGDDDFQLQIEWMSVAFHYSFLYNFTFVVGVNQ